MHISIFTLDRLGNMKELGVPKFGWVSVIQQCESGLLLPTQLCLEYFFKVIVTF